MTASGVFITPEELEELRTANQCSGMFLSGGVPIGNPQAVAHRLAEKYNIDASVCGLSTDDGQFYLP